MQRYIERFPAAGEIVIFDRSWYNRAGVEYVMGFCTEQQHKRFLELCPQIEKYMTDGGIQLIKIWLEVGKDEQERRFAARIEDPLRQWKLSPMDLESYGRWYDYSRARDLMLKMTDSKHAPWYIVRSDDKRRARLNCISHILSQIPFKKITRPKSSCPSARPSKNTTIKRLSRAETSFLNDTDAKDVTERRGRAQLAGVNRPAGAILPQEPAGERCRHQQRKRGEHIPRSIRHQRGHQSKAARGGNQ